MPRKTAVVSARALVVGAGGNNLDARTVDLDVANGQRVAVIADNGRGKTTLLATLALMRPPLAGELRLFDRDAADLAFDDRAVLKRRLGLALAEERWLGALDATENLALPLRVHGEDAATIGAIVEEFLAWLGLGAEAARPVATLAPGRRRLLAIARAAVTRPDLLLLDEPLDGLDDRAVARVRQLVDELARLGCAIIVASARRETARRLACRPVELDDHGSPAPPRLEAAG